MAAIAASSGPAQLLRLNPDGTFIVSSGAVQVFSDPLLAIETDGTLVLAGLDAGSDCVLQEFASNGGAIGTPFVGGSSAGLDGFSPAALAIQPGGKIVAAGVDAVLGEWAMARFNPGGTLDSAFGDAGDGMLHGASPISGALLALAIDGLGNILAAGSSPDAVYTSATDAVLARFTSGGLGLPVSGSQPALDSIGVLTANAGGTLNLGPIGFQDPDPGETHTATIAWGDGTTDDATLTEPTTDNGDPVNGTISGSHTYTAVNTSYTGTVNVTNSAGVSASRTFTVNVTAATVALDQFVASIDGAALDVTYTVSGADAGPFDIGLYTHCYAQLGFT